MAAAAIEQKLIPSLPLDEKDQQYFTSNLGRGGFIRETDGMYVPDVIYIGQLVTISASSKLYFGDPKFPEYEGRTGIVTALTKAVPEYKSAHPRGGKYITKYLSVKLDRVDGETSDTVVTGLSVFGVLQQTNQRVLHSVSIAKKGSIYSTWKTRHLEVYEDCIRYRAQNQFSIPILGCRPIGNYYELMRSTAKPAIHFGKFSFGGVPYEHSLGMRFDEGENDIIWFAHSDKMVVDELAAVLNKCFEALKPNTKVKAKVKSSTRTSFCTPEMEEVEGVELQTEVSLPSTNGENEGLNEPGRKSLIVLNPPLPLNVVRQPTWVEKIRTMSVEEVYNPFVGETVLEQ